MSPQNNIARAAFRRAARFIGSAWLARVIGISLALGALGVVGCASSKDLNERSGRELLKEATADAYYPVPLAGLAPLMQRSVVDFALLAATMKEKGVENGVAIMVFGRLLEQKMMVAQTDKVPYPNIRGRFRSDSKYSYDEYDLQLVPNTNNIKGVRYQQGQNETRQRQSEVTGTVEASGLVQLGRSRFQYKEEGTTAWLMDKDAFNVVNYKGAVSGPPVEVTWYTYSFTPELQSQIVKTNDAPFGIGTHEVQNGKGGTYEIGELTELQLVLETSAVASFSWTASLNRFGRAFYGTDKPSGKGRVGFAKKPDGTWFVKNWCTANCMF